MSKIDELEAASKSTRAAAEAYSTEITEKYRREIPPKTDDKGKQLPVTPELTVERARAWTDAEREHLDTLRKAATAAAVALHRARQQPEGHTSGE